MPRWDRQADVVVVGCGFAGAMAAIAAHDAGASVLILEKMPDPGGISVCSFGGVRVAKSAEAAFAYLKRTNGGTAPDALLRTLAKGMEALPAQLAKLAKSFPIELSNREAHGNYPFDGYDTFAFVNVEAIEGFDGARAYPHVRGAPGGRLMFRFIEMCLEHRGLKPQTRTAAEELVVEKGRVVGLIARQGSKRVAIRAKRGLVLACGGFEGNAELQKQFWPEQPVLNAAFRGNTGDGIRLAQSVGAGLWHMWHYHGSYGFKHTDPKYPFGIRTKRLPDWLPGAGPRGDVRMPWILLDRRGRRFTNEYDPYLQDTGARALGRYDPLAQDYAALPAWLIADADGTQLYPFGRPTSHERGIAYDWSANNEAEIASGILQRASSVEALAQAIGVPGHKLASTLSDWNAACTAQRDEDWGRPPSSMTPILKAPFTYAPVWPIVSNTQGGPVHDARQRVLSAEGRPIPGLYAAGELGSLFGHLYLSGGNIAECFVGGRIAGREAALRGRG
jgi:succinate dehydrogenase/fumarate reductase flavoprotein subunit